MKTITVWVFLVCLMNSFAENGAPPGSSGPDRSDLAFRPHNVGIGAGRISGTGISYRRWYPSANGYQITLAPFGKISTEESEGVFNLGINGLRSFYSNTGFKFLNAKNARSNGFVYYGGSYSGKYSENEERDVNDSVSIEYDEVITHSMVIGGGVGFELHIWRMNFSLMIGFAAAGKIEILEEESSEEAEETKRMLETVPSAEVAIYVPFGSF